VQDVDLRISITVKVSSEDCGSILDSICKWL